MLAPVQPIRVALHDAPSLPARTALLGQGQPAQRLCLHAGLGRNQNVGRRH